MLYILYFYIAFILFFTFDFSRKGVFYIFSPFITIYLAFAVNDVIPLIAALSTDIIEIPENLKYVTTTTAIINILSLLIFKNQLQKKISITTPYFTQRILKQRKKIFTLFISLILFAGIITGVTPALIKGINVEDLRRTSEIGIGFIRTIPLFGIPYILLVYLFSKTTIGFLKKGLICLFIGIGCFFTTAARGDILTYAIVFFIWFNISKRAFKWYEYYGVFYILSPIIATFLFLLRGGGGIKEGLWNSFFSQQFMIFGANTLRLMNYITDENLFWGESYYTDIIKIIPRFIWPDKPVSIDYKYKELVGLEFEGGGIYTTTPNDFYLNFGTYYFISYIIWILIIHYLYRKLADSTTSFYNKIALVLFLSLYYSPKTIIGTFEVYILFLILCYLFTRKWKTI
jgi:hypothetical protein